MRAEDLVVSTRIADEILKTLECMPESMQRSVLEYATALHAGVRPPADDELAAFRGTITHAEAEEMWALIQDNCRRVEPDGW